MKKLIWILTGCVAVALAVWAAAPPWDDNAGHHVPGNLIVGGALTVGGTAITATNAGTTTILSNKLAAAITQQTFNMIALQALIYNNGTGQTNITTIYVATNALTVVTNTVANSVATNEVIGIVLTPP